MSDPIECKNCGITPEDLSLELPLNVGILTGSFIWYCSESCYEENTESEG